MDDPPQFAEDLGTFLVSFWVENEKNDRENSPPTKVPISPSGRKLGFFFEQKKVEDEIGDDLVGCVFGWFFWKRWDLFFCFWRGDRIGSCSFLGVFFAKMRAVMNIGGEYFASYDVKRRMERLSVSL